MLAVWCCVLPVAMAVFCVSGAGGSGLPAGWSRYSVETTVVVSAPGSELPTDLGYRLRGTLELLATVSPSPGNDDEMLLAFRFQEMQLLLRGAGREADYTSHASAWDARDDTVWAARGARGRVARLLHDPALPAHVLDYARAIASLFQFDVDGGEERNESDVSGECSVTYERLAPDTLRKVKRTCEHDAAAGVEARRLVRYTLPAAGAAPTALHADEVVTSRLADLAVKARSLHVLALLDHRTARAAPAPAPPAPPPHYVEAILAMRPIEPPDPDDALSVTQAVEEFGAALDGGEAGGGGTPAGVAALLRLVLALQTAGGDELTRLLRADRDAARLRALCGALGLAGTGAAAAAVRRADLPDMLVLEYLAGLSLASAPQVAAVDDALARAEDKRASQPLRDAALLATGAAAARSAGDVAARVRDRLTRNLARCKDEGCRRVRVAALGNTRAPEVVDTLLAQTGYTAVAALGGVPRLRPEQLARLGARAGNTSRPLEERAAALDLLAERECRGAALPLVTAGVWRALHAERSPDAGELRRLAAQRVAAGGERGHALLAALPAQMRGWDAPPGHSTVLVRGAGWAAGGWHARLDSRQVTSRGLLRRGRVALVAESLDALPAPLLAVELWTRGLGALAGSDDAGGSEEETMAAGLGLAVAGVSLPNVDLFEGQGELIGHVWAGTASSDTRVVRAGWLPAAWRGALPLAGGVTLGVRGGVALTAALDARASVSLWQRAARGVLSLRAAAAARLSATLAPPSGALRVEARAGAAPRLRIHADLDFYDGVALCVRAATAPHDELREVLAESTQGARAWRVTRARTTRVSRAGRTLSLGRENDAACRTLRSADDADADGDGDH